MHPEHNTSFEQEFAAFTNGHSEFRRDEVVAATLEDHPPVAVVVAEQPPVQIAPPPAVVVPISQPTEPTQAESLLGDLDRATQSLSSFREQIGRVVELQRTTADELGEVRRQLAALEVRSAEDRRRLESELARERELVSTVRSRLGELFSALEAR